MRWGKLVVLVGTAVGLSACSISPEDQALIDSVVTALPSEVEGCSFVGNVDNLMLRPTIEGARNDLRLQAARLGANHVVETHLVVTPYHSFWWSERDFEFPGYASMINAPEFYLSGRAYLCPEGKGVKRAVVPQPVAAQPSVGPQSAVVPAAQPVAPATAKQPEP